MPGKRAAHIMLKMCTKTTMVYDGFQCSVQTGSFIICGRAEVSVQH